MEFHLEKDERTCTVHLLGSLTEEVERVFAAVVAELGERRTLVFDCGSVRRVHFLGMMAWIRGLEQLGAGVRWTFTRCGPEFINAALMVPRFCGGGLVESIYVDFTCVACGEVKPQLYRVSLRSAGLVQQPGVCRACSGATLCDEDAPKDLEMLIAQNGGRDAVEEKDEEAQAA